MCATHVMIHLFLLCMVLMERDDKTTTIYMYCILLVMYPAHAQHAFQPMVDHRWIV